MTAPHPDDVNTFQSESVDGYKSFMKSETRLQHIEKLINAECEVSCLLAVVLVTQTPTFPLKVKFHCD